MTEIFEIDVRQTVLITFFKYY